MRLGDYDVLTSRELDAMIEQAKQHVRDSGMPQSAVDRVTQLGFHCVEHGISTTLVVYRAGLLIVYCRECERQIAIFAIAEEFHPVAEIGSEESWN